jgi:outer membrane biosynthesis protein TonB
MNHPFELDLTELAALNLTSLDLEFEEDLCVSEISQLHGARQLYTRCGNEQGNYNPPPRPSHPSRPICPQPTPPPKPICPPEPPMMTTMALGEEGGWCPPPYTTLALGEEGGGWSE